MSEISSIGQSDQTDSAAAVYNHSYSPYVGGGKSPNENVAEVGFDDFLDMINPLQHIPVLSAAYRAIADEPISPMARIGGDVLYGGIMGAASAGISAMIAIADEAFTEVNGGDSVAKTAIAGLFGEDSPKTQLADSTHPTATETPTVQSQLAVLQTPATQSPILSLPELAQTAEPAFTAAGEIKAASTEPLVPSTDVKAPQTVAATSDGKAIPIDRSKLAYGGAMDTSLVHSAMENQTLALALATSQGKMKDEHNLRNNRFLTTPTNQLAAAKAVVSTTSLTGETSSAAPSIPGVAGADGLSGMPISLNAGSATNKWQAMQRADQQAASKALASSARSANGSDPIPQSLINDIQAMKGLDQYRRSAMQSTYSGSTYDAAN